MRAYAVLNRRWGNVCTWSNADGRLCVASSRFPTDDMRGMRPVSTYETVGHARIAISDTIDYFSRNGGGLSPTDFLIFAVEVEP